MGTRSVSEGWAKCLAYASGSHLTVVCQFREITRCPMGRQTQVRVRDHKNAEMFWATRLTGWFAYAGRVRSFACLSSSPQSC